MLSLFCRFSGRPEMVVMTGSWPNYYLSAWQLTTEELTNKRKWTNTSVNNTGAISYNSDPKIKAIAPRAAPTDPNVVRHQFCALIPNEPMRNGQNVLLVSSYRNREKGINVINFRTYLRLGNQRQLRSPLKPNLRRRHPDRMCLRDKHRTSQMKSWCRSPGMAGP